MIYAKDGGDGRLEDSALEATSFPVATEALCKVRPIVPRRAARSKRARCSSVGRPRLMRRVRVLRLLSLLSEKPHDVVECLFNVDAVFGGGLHEFAAKLLCEGVSFLRGDGTLDGLVTLVSDEHDGNRAR